MLANRICRGVFMSFGEASSGDMKVEFYRSEEAHRAREFSSTREPDFNLSRILRTALARVEGWRPQIQRSNQ
jgi:hypothetical protein